MPPQDSSTSSGSTRQNGKLTVWLLKRAQTNGWSPNGCRTGIRIDRANRTIELYAAKLENGLTQRSIIAEAGALDLAPEAVLFRSGIASWIIV